MDGHTEGVDDIKQIIQGQQVQSPTMTLDKSYGFNAVIYISSENLWLFSSVLFPPCFCDSYRAYMSYLKWHGNHYR